VLQISDEGFHSLSVRRGSRSVERPRLPWPRHPRDFDEGNAEKVCQRENDMVKKVLVGAW
jgi:hypothetical protein